MFSNKKENRSERRTTATGSADRRIAHRRTRKKAEGRKVIEVRNDLRHGLFLFLVWF